MPVETEIKYQLTPQQFVAVLEANKGEPCQTMRQVDTYFKVPGGDISMRIREEQRAVDSSGSMMLHGRTACLTIKQSGSGAHGSGVYSSQEIEPVLPGTSADVLKNLFRVLDIPFDITVEKLRREWTSQGCKMALDDVKGLGYFMEIEVLGENEEAARARINDIIKQYGFDHLRVAKGGYPSLLRQRINRL